LKRFFIGIDPGLSGGISVIDQNESVLCCVPMPISGGEINARLLAAYLQRYMKEGSVSCVLEKVAAMPGQGVCAMFTFGQVVGEIKSVLKMLKVPYQEATPVSWKKAILEGLSWKADYPKLKLENGLTEDQKKEQTKAHNSRKAKAKKDAKLVGCTFIERRFPSVDLYLGKKNPHDGMAESLCMAIYAKKICS
jgi:crossover junction endodeoxyribonuclease RuvC